MTEKVKEITFIVDEVIVYIDPDKDKNSGVFKIIGFAKNDEGESIVIIKDNSAITREVPLNDIRKLNMAFVCEQCGSFLVEAEAWVNVNTNKYVEDRGDADHWCNSCGADNIETVEQSDIYEPYIEALKSI